VRREWEPRGVGFLAVSLEQDAGRVRRAVAEWKLTMRVATATGELLGPLWVREVPSTVFVDAQGILVAAASGPKSQRFLAARVRELMARSPAPPPAEPVPAGPP
jgi:hypothetical protein